MGLEDVSLNVVLRQVVEEEVDGGKVRAVGSLIVSGTAGEYPNNHTPAVDDHRARVSRPGGQAGSGVARQHGDLPRNLTGLALEVTPNKRTGRVVEVSDSELRDAAGLDDHNGWVVVGLGSSLHIPLSLSLDST